MGGKPRPNHKLMAEKLAGLAIFALNRLDTKSTTALLFNIKTGHARRWQEEFFDVLDECGIHYDRADYYLKKYPPKKGRKR